MVDTACAVITSGQAKAPTPPTDINLFYCIHGHTHEGLLKQTANQQGVSLSGELHERRRCSMAKGLRKPIARSTDTRAGPFCPSRAPAALAPHCRRGGVYSGGVYSGGGRERGGNERGGRVKSRRREGSILGQRVRPRHSGGGPRLTRKAQGASEIIDLDSESDLDMTGMGSVLSATRKAPAVEAGAGTGRVAEGNSLGPSVPSRRAEIKAIPRHNRPRPGGPKSAV